MLYLQQEDLAALRKRVTEDQEAHRAALRELTLIEERKTELVAELTDTENLIKLGKMPPVRENLMELAQSRALGVYDNRKSARHVIL